MLNSYNGFVNYTCMLLAYDYLSTILLRHTVYDGILVLLLLWCFVEHT